MARSAITGSGTAAAERRLALVMAATHDHTCPPVGNDSDDCALPPTPGLWAVEPHIGKDGVGARWGEILVVTPDDAYWLDLELPHHSKWRRMTPLPS